MARQTSIIIPTKNRANQLEKLLHSIARVSGVGEFVREIIVADNNSQDETRLRVSSLARSFPCPVVTVEVARPGKSAAVNEAVRVSRGELLALLDDDVLVDSEWLVHIQRFWQDRKYSVGQGRILLEAPEGDDPEIKQLMQRYRTIPYLNFSSEIEEVHSLNGANFIIERDLLKDLGGFDERLGPGASGTSEDVDLSRRIRDTGRCIGYMRNATVYHSVDRRRFTEEYFRLLHRRQGHSRLVMKPRSTAHILCNLGRVSLQHAFLLIGGEERRVYRSKGRIQHYLGMLEAKRKANDGADHDRSPRPLTARIT